MMVEQQKKTIIITTHYIEEASKANCVSFFFIEIPTYRKLLNVRSVVFIFYNKKLDTNIIRNLGTGYENSILILFIKTEETGNKLSFN